MAWFFNIIHLCTMTKVDFFFICDLILADGTYAVKKVLIQNKEQLELVREEIRVSSLFNHPNLLPLLDHAIISVKVDKHCSQTFMVDYFSL